MFYQSESLLSRGFFRAIIGLFRTGIRDCVNDLCREHCFAHLSQLNEYNNGLLTNPHLIWQYYIIIHAFNVHCQWHGINKTVTRSDKTSNLLAGTWEYIIFMQLYLCVQISGANSKSGTCQNSTHLSDWVISFKADESMWEMWWFLVCLRFADLRRVCYIQSQLVNVFKRFVNQYCICL